MGNVGKVASVDDTPPVEIGRSTFPNCGSHPQRADDSRHCVPSEGPRGLCLEPTSNGSTEYCALRTTTMRKGFYLMPQVKCDTSETCNGVAMATAACSSSNNWGHMGRYLDSSYLAHGDLNILPHGAIIPFCRRREKFRPRPVFVFQHKGGMDENHVDSVHAHRNGS